MYAITLEVPILDEERFCLKFLGRLLGILQTKCKFSNNALDSEVSSLEHKVLI